MSSSQTAFGPNSPDCVGNLIGPQTFRAKDAPNYTPCYVTCIVCVALVGATQVAIYFVYRHENAKRDRLEGTDGVHLFKESEDLTDRWVAVFEC